MKRILLVDDEPMVRQGLQRMLYGMRQEWDMQFAAGAQEALNIMSAQPVDVIVSDMRMPGMNGAELLNQVMQRWPKTVRFILSGYADMEMVMQCVGGTHQFLSKPCDADTLRTTIRRAMDLEHWINNDQMKSLVSRMTSIPSLPSLYFQILTELRSADATVQRVGELIAQDPAMTAKMLQLANSAFFGLRRQLSDPTDAVNQLGLETIKSLVLSIHIFANFDSNPALRAQVEQLQHHSLKTAAVARQIARLEKKDRALLDESFTAGLLHDIGRLVLVTNMHERYAEVSAVVQKESVTLQEAERAVFGVNHSEVGGYLLGLWGLPIAIVEAAVFHHCPREQGHTGFTSLTAVHAADFLAHEVGEEPQVLGAPLDKSYLSSAGVLEQLPVWRQAVQEMEK